MATATKKPVTATRYYLATCGSIYRVRTVTGGTRTENGTWQARRTQRAAEFEPEYPADPRRSGPGRAARGLHPHHQPLQ